MGALPNSDERETVGNIEVLQELCFEPLLYQCRQMIDLFQSCAQNVKAKENYNIFMVRTDLKGGLTVPACRTWRQGSWEAHLAA